MKNAFSLTSILTQAQCDFKIVDLSRRVVEITHEDFCAIEQNSVPYPFPIKQHAEIGIAFWTGEDMPWVWFLKIPLDERGLLTQKSLGDFVQYVAQAIDSKNKNNVCIEKETQKQNPYIFSPQDDKKAIFHALIRAMLKEKESQYYAKAKEYLCGERGFENWQDVGLQGFADICARLQQENNETHKDHLKCIQNALLHMPETPKYALLGCLEHVPLPEPLAEQLEALINSSVTKNNLLISRNEIDIFLVSAYLRATAGANPKIRQRIIQNVLSNKALHHKEILMAIAGRCWESLSDPDLLLSYLVVLAQENDPLFFQKMVTSLVMIPKLRPALLMHLHGHTSALLVDAVHQFQQSVRQGVSFQENEFQEKTGVIT